MSERHDDPETFLHASLAATRRWPMRARGVVVAALQQVRRAAAPHRRAGQITETALSFSASTTAEFLAVLPTATLYSVSKYTSLA